MVVSEEFSWKMFRGNVMRTGISSSNLSRTPSLQRVMELGPMVASPVFDNSIVYAATITGRIFALKAYQWGIKWQSNIGSPIISSPSIQQDLLIAATFDSWVKGTAFLGKNFVLALNAKTGEQVWSFEIDGDIFSSPCIIQDMIIVGSMNKNILAIDMRGHLKWVFETEGEVWSSPSFNGEQIFVGSDDGFLYCLNLEGKIQWKTRLNGKIRSSSPCLSYYNNLIFIGTHNGVIYCLNQSDGLIRWSKQLTKPVLSSAAVLKDRVFFASSDKKIYCIDCNTGSKIWEFETGGRIWSSPAITENDKVLFFGSLDSHIYGLDMITGKQIWKFPTMNMIDSSPCIASKMLLIGARDGLLYAFGSREIASYVR
jgi:outer membrane protein assembly factor BamB